MTPEFRRNETPIPPKVFRCRCGTKLSGDDTVWTIDGEETTADVVEGDELEEGDVFCSPDCAHETRCEAKEAAWFEDAAYGRDV